MSNNIVIVATDRKGCIGKNGDLPFKSDLKFFKELTVGNVVIMGRKTWDSLIIQPLPDRINIIVSTQLPDGRFYRRDKSQSFYSYKSLKGAMDFAKTFNKVNFIIGGAKLYSSAFDAGLVDSVILTKFAVEVEDCDCYFPKTTSELEKLFKNWKTFQIDNDGEIALMRTMYTNEL